LASGIGCVFCASFGEPACDHAREEWLAIIYAHILADDPSAIDDTTFDLLQKEFWTEQVVGLTVWSLSVIAGQQLGAVMKLLPVTSDDRDVYTHWRLEGEAAAIPR
jgi:hypothetical protein